MVTHSILLGLPSSIANQQRWSRPRTGRVRCHVCIRESCGEVQEFSRCSGECPHRSGDEHRLTVVGFASRTPYTERRRCTATESRDSGVRGRDSGWAWREFGQVATHRFAAMPPHSGFHARGYRANIRHR